MKWLAVPAVAISLATATPAPSAVPTPAPSPSPATPTTPPADNSGHLYTLDAFGGVHPAGAAPALSAGAYWPNWDIARGLALYGDGSSGYVLDGWGGLHPVGAAPQISYSGYWPGWDIARGLALFEDGSGGYVLDGWGGLHPVGDAPAVQAGAYWPGWDIARGLVLLPGSQAGSVGGYVLDGWGGVHPFGAAPAVTVTGYWPNWDIARGITLLPAAGGSGSAGYVLDGWGALYPFGGAPAVNPSAYWSGTDLARGVVSWTAAPAGRPGGWTLDAFGGVHEYGSAPSLQPGGYWPGWDIARGIGGTGVSSGVRGAVVGGVIQNVAYHGQQYALSCEAAALQMALSHEGRFPAQSSLLAAMSIDGRAGYYDGSGTLHWGDPYDNFVGNPNGSEPSLTGYGTYWSNVMRVATGEGATVLLAGDVSPSDLYAQVLAGHPVVAWVAYDWRWHATGYWYAWDGKQIPWAGPVEHAVTVVGVTASSVYVYNPIGGAQWVSKSSFEAGYATYRDMAVVIS